VGVVHLLDTQAFLYIVADDPRLGATARARFLDPANEFRLSVASAWEMSIKVSLGKLTLPDRPGPWLREQLAENRIVLLPVELDHAARVAELPFHHGDPFDRLLAAQALAEKLPFLSGDSAFDAYGVERIW
jgi:PIN domain nuclease of toxin-antitoxin system